MHRFRRGPLLLWVSLLAVWPTTAVSARVVDDPSFAGAWESTYGRMDLRQHEGAVTGTYPLGRIDGTVEGRRLTFEYHEAEVSGTGWFELADDGASFRGEWSPDGVAVRAAWSGTRLGPPTPWSGLWKTSWGRMRLNQDGDHVAGRYEQAGGATIRGTVKDGEFTFEYHEVDASGQGHFTLAEDGASFAGKWRPEGASAWRDWSGTRTEPQPHRAWLVVLEAHWEEALADREYAFGDMLQSYFTMGTARHVEVRHRFFHDEADLVRMTAAAAFLPGPVVLLYSTHGTPAGVQVGGETIGPEAIAGAISGCSNVQLLHLSGCSMMRGGAAEQIQAALPEGQRLPISGYTTNVAWDSSALGDFIFLSHLLIRAQSPAEAVAQTHLAAPFTASAPVPGASFAPLGLTLRPHDD